MPSVCRRLIIAAVLLSVTSYCRAACVWKVTSAAGNVLYLAGSIHALSSTDYPLPSAYNRAFDASSQLVFEDDPKRSSAGIKALFKAGTYPKGDSLKYHVDLRTYAYLRRFFALLNISEEKFSKFRPWLIDLMLESPSSEHFELGVETFLTKRAQANSKPVSGLESTT